MRYFCFVAQVAALLFASAEAEFYFVCEILLVMPPLCKSVEIGVSNVVFIKDLLRRYFGRQIQVLLPAQQAGFSMFLLKCSFGGMGVSIGVGLLSGVPDLVEFYSDLVFDFVKFGESVFQLGRFLLHGAVNS